MCILDISNLKLKLFREKKGVRGELRRPVYVLFLVFVLKKRDCDFVCDRIFVSVVKDFLLMKSFRFCKVWVESKMLTMRKV